MIKTLLIANRGEIACRICRTAKRLGIRTVAVYSEADATALHVKSADIAYPIGPAAATESYLNIAVLLDVARRAGADAVHPGYGFLSENAEFARRCEAAGLIFVGPSADAIATMGSKSAAKALMTEAGVPVVPGYHGEAQDLDTLTTQAAQCGFPLLIKASAGGGGKGMRVVASEAELSEQLDAVKREAAASFGDDHVLIERYLQNPRHIEVQVFADHHGHIVHLFERDCSVQRRHQKIIEEAPAPDLDDEQRERMHRAAVDAAAAINYRGAGTIEFIVEGDEFFFMEMNTRLQVEHPVTEMITGQDLVEWQLKVAGSDPLPMTQPELQLQGHSIEVRLYAEDTDNQFLPSTGWLEHLAFPDEHAGLRIDSGFTQGDEVSVHYDPMMAKIIVHAANRDDAIATMLHALAQTGLFGVKHNIDYLQRVLGSAAFRQGKLSTRFIDTFSASLQAPENNEYLLLAIAAVTQCHVLQQQTLTNPLGNSGWRLNSPARFGFYLEHAGNSTYTTVELDPGNNHRVTLDNHQLLIVRPLFSENSVTFTYADDPVTAQFFSAETAIGIRLISNNPTDTVNGDIVHHNLHYVSVKDHPAAASNSGVSDANLVSPMPGKVLRVLVSEGDQVEEGAALMIIEAMKMEHTIHAPYAGVIEAVNFAEGSTVANNEPLLKLE